MYRSITLPNGAKLLTEFVPGARTAALGFFVGTGSRHERAAESGAQIEAAEAAVEALNDKQRDKLPNLTVLEEAQTEYETVLEEQAVTEACVQEAENAIDAIGSVTLDSGDTIRIFTNKMCDMRHYVDFDPRELCGIKERVRFDVLQELLGKYSGDELVYNATLGDWRTHNGVDAAAAAGDEVPAVKGGRVSVVEDDALWGGVVEIVDANGCTWRYCGVTPSCVVGGDAAAGDVIGVVAAIPAEADLASHVHLECLKDGAWMKPEI